MLFTVIFLFAVDTLFKLDIAVYKKELGLNVDMALLPTYRQKQVIGIGEM